MWVTYVRGNVAKLGKAVFSRRGSAEEQAEGGIKGEESGRRSKRSVIPAGHRDGKVPGLIRVTVETLNQGEFL